MKYYCKCGTKQSGSRKIDQCMVKMLDALKNNGYKVMACCCGHGKYEPTIVVKGISSLLSIVNIVFVVNPVKLTIKRQEVIPRIRNFYKTDDDEDYYIPEVMDKKD